MIIDFHTHTFPDKIAAATVKHLAGFSHSRPWSDGSVYGLAQSMKKSGIDCSVNLPVATDISQVEKVNRNLVRDREHMQKYGIISLGCMHPDYDNYKEELRFLQRSGIKGIKLHPAYQNTDLDDLRMLKIIDAASALDMIVLIHAGIDIGLPEHNYSSVSQILTVIDRLQPPKFVLAHMGGWGVWNEVEKDLAGAQVWLDTAFSIGPIIPRNNDPVSPYRDRNLSDEDFIRLVKKHGADRILFATDSPWADQSDYVRRIRNMSFTESEKQQILGSNAMKLLYD